MIAISERHLHSTISARKHLFENNDVTGVDEALNSDPPAYSGYLNHAPQKKRPNPNARKIPSKLDPAFSLVID